MAVLEPLPAEPALWMFFFGGALAVSAWLLPAVSGSFLLLVLGLYESVLAALTRSCFPFMIKRYEMWRRMVCWI